jgi:1-phosphofructokinase family hexose kinase
MIAQEETKCYVGREVILVAAPNPALDTLYSVGSLVPGAIHRPTGVVERAGGKGLNVARVASTLGAPVTAVALLAGHTGRRIAGMLHAEGVPFDAVQAPGETRGTFAVLDEASGNLTEFYDRGSASIAQAWSAYCRRLLDGRAAGAWLALSGSLPPGVEAAESARLVRAARALGMLVAVDQDGEPLEAALSARPSLVKVNEREAAGITGAGPEQSAALLSERADGATVIVTLGDRGALLLHRRELWHGDLDVRGRHTTGCGDAFLAGVLAVRVSGRGGWVEALAGGLGAAAANAEQPGAGTIDPARARALAARALERIRRRPLGAAALSRR